MISNFKQIVTKDFALLTVCFMLGFSPIFFFLLFPLHLKEIGAFQYQIGIAMGISSIGALVSKPYAGKWMDRRGRRKIAYAGYLISVCSLLAMLIYTSIPLYYILRLFFGIGMGFCMTGLYTIVLDISPPNMLGQAVGLFGMANFIVSGISTIIGEYLLSCYGFQAILMVSVVNLSLSMVLFSFIGESHTVNDSAGIPFFKTMTGPVRTYAFSTFVFGAVHGALYSFIAVYLKELDFKQVSLFFVFYALGAISLRIFFGYLVDQVSKSALITLNFILYGVILILIPVFHRPPMVFFFAFSGGVSHGFLFPALNLAVVNIVGSKWRGTGASIFFIAFDSGLGIGPFVFGYFAGIFGYGRAYQFTGALLFIYCITAYKSKFRHGSA